MLSIYFCRISFVRTYSVYLNINCKNAWDETYTGNQNGGLYIPVLSEFNATKSIKQNSASFGKCSNFLSLEMFVIS